MVDVSSLVKPNMTTVWETNAIRSEFRDETLFRTIRSGGFPANYVYDWVRKPLQFDWTLRDAMASRGLEEDLW